MAKIQAQTRPTKNHLQRHRRSLTILVRAAAIVNSTSSRDLHFRCRIANTQKALPSIENLIVVAVILLFPKTSMSLRKPPIPRLLLNNVSCMRNAQQILRHVNVSLHDGGALVLTGTNGSGKTTFLRMLAGFSKPSAGQILWNGHDITQSGVFHQYKLQLNWLSLKDAIKEKFTVLDNVQWFEVLEGKQGNSMPALELMGLGRLAKEKARLLSMGQRKRLQLARLLALDRPIWLLDEPSVALDDDGVKLLEYIISEHRKKGGIVIVATHLPIKMEDAMYLRLPPRFPRRITLQGLKLTTKLSALWDWIQVLGKHMTLSLQGGDLSGCALDLMKEGSTVILLNAKIDMFKGSMRLAVDKWSRVEVTEPADFTVKEDNNLSLIEYVQ
nr:abc transporter i family member 1 [Quercus suber]